MPYTHPMPITSFISTIVGTDLFLVTAGGEGTIRTWRFNPTSGSFEHIMLLEGHTRGVTSLVLQGSDVSLDNMFSTQLSFWRRVKLVVRVDGSINSSVELVRR
jgi:hypothetical protein